MSIPDAIRAAAPRPVPITAGGASADQPVAAGWFQAASPRRPYKEAEQWALRAQELGSSDDLATQLFALGVRSRVSARNGDIGAALELASQADSLAATSEDPRDPGDAALNLAEIMYRAGDPQRAEEMTQGAIDCYLSKGATAVARRARRLAAGWASPHGAAGSEVTHPCSQEPEQLSLSIDAPVTRPRSHDD